MTIIGVILLVVGAGATGLLYTGNAPAFLATMPIGIPVWIGVAVVGAILIYFNRRPGD